MQEGYIIDPRHEHYTRRTGIVLTHLVTTGRARKETAFCGCRILGKRILPFIRSYRPPAKIPRPPPTKAVTSQGTSSSAQATSWAPARPASVAAKTSAREASFAKHHGLVKITQFGQGRRAYGETKSTQLVQSTLFFKPMPTDGATPATTHDGGAEIPMTEDPSPSRQPLGGIYGYAPQRKATSNRIDSRVKESGREVVNGDQNNNANADGTDSTYRSYSESASSCTT